MQALVLTTAAVHSATAPYAVGGVRLRHTGAATATIEDGGGREVISLVITTGKLEDTIMFPQPLMMTGFEVATISAGTLYVYLE